MKPIHLRAFEKENPSIRTGSRWTTEHMREERDRHRELTTPRGPRYSVVADPDAQQQRPLRAVVFSPVPANYQWGSTRAEKLYRAFQDGIRELRQGERDFRVGWKGPKCGWDTYTGLPKNAVEVHSHIAYPSVCGPGRSYIAAINAAWGPEFQLDYQKLELKGRSCTVVWPEPVEMNRQVGETMSRTQRINQLVRFLQNWGAIVERGLHEEYPITEAYAGWRADKNREIRGESLDYGRQMPHVAQSFTYTDAFPPRRSDSYRPSSSQVSNLHKDKNKKEHSEDELNSNPYKDEHRRPRVGRSYRKRPRSEDDNENDW